MRGRASCQRGPGKRAHRGTANVGRAAGDGQSRITGKELRWALKRSLLTAPAATAPVADVLAIGTAGAPPAVGHVKVPAPSPAKQTGNSWGLTAVIRIASGQAR